MLTSLEKYLNLMLCIMRPIRSTLLVEGTLILTKWLMDSSFFQDNAKQLMRKDILKALIGMAIVQKSVEVVLTAFCQSKDRIKDELKSLLCF